MSEHLLVILACSASREHLKVDWQHIAETLKKLNESLDPVVYRTAVDENSGLYVVGVFCAIDSQTTLPEIELIFGASLGKNVDIRLYEPLPSNAQISVPTSQDKHYLVLNGMTPNDAAEQTFNDWYAEEHIPMLSVVPGWRSSCRFRLISASGDPPRYLALHEWENRDAFGTAEFKAATNTPWRTRVVVEQVNKKERHLLEYLGTFTELNPTS
ncbi:hypothetical protein DFH06DRAFT_1332865 [Mycena polygramma]|nr:hypothetical protein DFH06DRAFT_1332865 [Mycena polygramma]